MNKDEILNELFNLVAEGNQVLYTKWEIYVDLDAFKSWRFKVITFLKSFLPETHDFVRLIQELVDNDYENATICVKTLENIMDYIQKEIIHIEQKEVMNGDYSLEKIFMRFHKVARQLRHRHSGRHTLEIEDEYDVQDLLHALFQLDFDDVRPEEWTPSYAGKCARVDFLLKNEKIVIEVKKTRQGLADKELGDQLIIDVERYKTHPDCQKLICFVYDPEERIGNPNGIINDLNRQHNGFVKVIIQPSM